MFAIANQSITSLVMISVCHSQPIYYFILAQHRHYIPSSSFLLAALHTLLSLLHRISILFYFTELLALLSSCIQPLLALQEAPSIQYLTTFHHLDPSHLFLVVTAASHPPHTFTLSPRCITLLLFPLHYIACLHSALPLQYFIHFSLEQHFPTHFGSPFHSTTSAVDTLATLCTHN